MQSEIATTNINLNNDFSSTPPPHPSFGIDARPPGPSFAPKVPPPVFAPKVQQPNFAPTQGHIAQPMVI